MKNLWSIICLFGCLVSSCITNRDTILLQKKGDVSHYSRADFEYYKLQPNDRVVYTIYSTDIETARLFSGVSGTAQGQSSSVALAGYRIYPDGNVVLPFIGKLRLVGLTCKEAAAVLRAKIRESLPDAEIRLVLASDYFYVVGSGRFQIEKDRMTILEALSTISTKEKTLDKKHIRLMRRQNDGSYLIKTIDLRSESILNSEYYYVKPNDVYYIPTSNKAFYNITSFSGFLGFVMVPVSFLLLILNL